MSKKTTGSYHLPLMRTAELVLANGFDFAVALSYIPRETPVVIARGRGRGAKDLIWAAQEMDVPIVETSWVDRDFYNRCRDSEEIPAEIYHVVASALAFLYKSRETPHMMRFFRPLRSRPSALLVKTEEMVERYGSVLEISLLSLELGKSLFEAAEEMKDPLNSLRSKLGQELGLILPEINVVLNQKLNPYQYRLCLRDVPCYKGEVEEGRYEPMDFLSHITNRFRHLIRRDGWQLLGYAEIQALVNRFARHNADSADLVNYRDFSLSTVRFVLINLLKEGIPIRDLAKILTVIKDTFRISPDPDVLTEYVRAVFASYLWSKYSDDRGIIHVMILSPEMENLFFQSIRKTADTSVFDIGDEELFTFLESLKNALERSIGMGISPVLMVSPPLRRFVKKLISSTFPELGVISYGEVVTPSDVRSVGFVG